MHVTRDAVLCVRYATGLVDAQEEFNMRMQQLPKLLTHTAKLVFNTASAFFTCALAPVLVYVSYAARESLLISPPPRGLCYFGLLSGTAAGLLMLNAELNKFCGHVYRLYNPRAACFYAFQKELREIFMMILNILLSLALLVAPYYLSAKVIHLLFF